MCKVGRGRERKRERRAMALAQQASPVRSEFRVLRAPPGPSARVRENITLYVIVPHPPAGGCAWILLTQSSSSSAVYYILTEYLFGPSEKL